MSTRSRRWPWFRSPAPLVPLPHPLSQGEVYLMRQLEAVVRGQWVSARLSGRPVATSLDNGLTWEIHDPAQADCGMSFDYGRLVTAAKALLVMCSYDRPPKTPCPGCAACTLRDLVAQAEGRPLDVRW